MRIIDISRELLSADCFQGDPHPRLHKISELSKGDLCNLSEISFCLHNGTHTDAPLHFIEGGAAADKLPLDKFIGCAKVAEAQGVLDGKAAQQLINDNPSRLLLKGQPQISIAAARVFANSLKLLGTEGLTVGGATEISDVHKILLSKGVAIIENLDLSMVNAGEYTLFAQPIKIAQGDGAPVRAVLIEDFDLQQSFIKGENNV